MNMVIWILLIPHYLPLMYLCSSSESFSHLAHLTFVKVSLCNHEWSVVVIITTCNGSWFQRLLSFCSRVSVGNITCIMGKATWSGLPPVWTYLPTPCIYISTSWRYLPPASDIWWSSLEICSNLFTLGPTLSPTVLTSSSGLQALHILLECFLVIAESTSWLIEGMRRIWETFWQF